MFVDLDGLFNGFATLFKAFLPPDAIPAAALTAWSEQLAAIRAGLAPIWGAEGDWQALEEHCRKLGFLFAGLLLGIAAWRKDVLSVPACCPVCRRRLKTRWLARTLKTTCGVVGVFRREARCRCAYFKRQTPATTWPTRSA